MKSFSKLKGQALKRATLGLLIAVWALVFSGCEDLTNGTNGLAEQAALAASRVSVGQPIPINDADELALIGIDPDYPVDSYYQLGASFPLDVWVPICDPNVAGAFTGIFDGAGYTITINSYDPKILASSDYIGIFAATSGADIHDLTVNLAAGIVETPAPNINNAHYVGGIVGRATSTMFNDITVNGSFDVVTVAAGTESVNIGLTTGSGEDITVFSNTTVKASLKVLYNGPDEGVVNSGGIVGYLADSKLSGGIFIDGLFSVNADMPYTYSLNNGVRLGGAAGYATNAGFYEITVDVSTAVNADTNNNPVYVGGVLGKGLAVTIADNTSKAVVTGNGPGYNTSAGGIAGYIQQSEVTDSSAYGAVALGATSDGTVNTLWQIYAGGLVGYSGGTAKGASLIDHSHACGAVSANSPYPYAGGLVGYNYGYIKFTGNPAEYAKLLTTGGLTASVTSNGSRITQSYATGNVQATSTPVSNGLPYAGGLVGYSSIPTATKDPAPNIENCYAKGNVIATTDSMYAWAGGLIGANAQGSIVSKTYAIGTVDVKVGENKLPYSQDGINPGAAGGGIAGVNYYVDTSSKLPALVTLSVGLNTLIYGTSKNTSVAPYLLHRVAGDLGQNDPLYLGKLDTNYGNSAMSILPVWKQDIGLNGLDGASVAAQPDQSFYTNPPLNWDFRGIWEMDADGYPILR